MRTELDLKQIVSVLRKRWWTVLLSLVLGTSAVAVYSCLLMKPVYQASTKLIVNSPADIAGFKLDLNAINTNISLINTYKEIIRTPAIMDLVVANHPEFGVTSADLSKNINFGSVNGTQVVTLTYPGHDYTKAANIVNEISRVFKEQIPLIMKVDNVHLLHEADPAKLPPPIKPNPKLYIAAGFVFSLLLGVGLVLLLDYLDDTIKTGEDVERLLGLSTLVMIPRTRGTEHSRSGPAGRTRASINRKAGESGATLS